MLITYLFTQPEIFIVWLICMLIGVSVHEFSHALAGYWEGDDTAQREGRLTFNPLKHIDWIGLLLLVIVGFGWGKPVPFNPHNLKHKKFGPALVSIAGPISNFILVILAGITLTLIANFSNLDTNNLLVIFLLSLMQINMILMLFNLLPVPPLDGSKILYVFLPYSMRHVVVFLETWGTWILFALLIFGSSFLSYVFNFFYTLVLNFFI